MSVAVLRDWSDRLEVARLHLHFARVRLWLRMQDSAPEMRPQRQQVIDELRRYAAQGVFPRNDTHPTMRPCFIDRDGRQCAVAHLLIQTGYNAEALQIAAQANGAFVAEMPFPELDIWAKQHGLTREELVVVQPMYPPTLDDLQRYTSSVLLLSAEIANLLRLLSAFLVLGGIGGVFSIFDWRKRRWGNIPPTLSLLAGILIVAASSLLISGLLRFMFSSIDAFPLKNYALIQASTSAGTWLMTISQAAFESWLLGLFLTLVGTVALFKGWWKNRREKAKIKEVQA